jgi:hypothetical protein
LSVSPAPATSAKSCVSLVSGSVALNVPTVVPAGSFSSTWDCDSAMSVGGSLTSPTSIVSVRSTERAGVPSSVARTRMEYVRLASKSKTSFVLSVEPAITNDALSPSPAPLTSSKAWVCIASWSTAASVPTVVPAGWFSSTVSCDSVTSLGTSLTSPTVTANTLSSVARTRIEYDRLAS